MARLWTTGFEDGSSREFSTHDGTTYVTSGPSPRSGVYSCKIPSGKWGEKLLPSTYTEFYLRAAVNFEDTVTGGVIAFFEWRKGSTVIGQVRRENDGTIGLCVGTTKVAGSVWTITDKNIWLQYEVYVKVHDTTGVITVRVDGTQVATFSGDTKPGADANIDRVRLMSGSGSNSDHCFDDVALNDTSGAADNSWPGEGKVIALTPNGAGASTQWTASAGSNYACVDEVPPNDDTDYVYQSSASGIDLYDLSACGLSNVTILRVWPELHAKKTSADAASIIPVIRTNSTNYEDSSTTLTTSYTKYKGSERVTNPNSGVAWTTSDLDALQAGVKGA